MNKLTFRTVLGLIPAAGIGMLLALAQAPAADAAPGDPPPPPALPGTPFLPNVGFIPGAYGYLYGVYVTPPPATVDARGVKAAALVDSSQQAVGMPGSQLGNSPPVAGFFTGASAQYYIGGGQTQTPPVVKGPDAMALSSATPPEDPSGIPPEKRPGPESTQPGPAPVVVPPILETPGGRPYGAAGGGAGGHG
ncbi:MAG: hypothetical protein JO236_21935 [Mycobacterium sp.]|uniref:hypothetical protein n=1 Tax=Mycobacterium sp. TaxID=1785 RepID=UPI001ED6333B|nr:hypothetical protein [Mycobacterium sp.]MBW0020180.1 hypothetical protein [Mycobacterium sp.]